MGALSIAMSFGVGHVIGAKSRKEPMRRLRDVTRDLVTMRVPERAGSFAERISGLRVADVMTAAPYTVPLDTPLAKAAQLMASNDVGDVIVIESNTGAVAGIVTDRDITIRAIAKGLDPSTTTVEEIFRIGCARRDPALPTVDLQPGNPLLAA